MIDFLAAEPNWIIVSLVGAVLGALVARFGGLIVYPFRRQVIAGGSWFLYHRTFRQGQMHLIRSRLTVKKGIFGGAKVSVVETVGSRTEEYTGSVTVEASHLLMQIKGIAVRNSASVLFRLESPVPPNDQVVFGLWLSYDLDRRPAVGVLMLSRTELSDNEADDNLNRWFDIHRTGVMRLRASPKPLPRRVTGA